MIPNLFTQNALKDLASKCRTVAIQLPRNEAKSLESAANVLIKAEEAFDKGERPLYKHYAACGINWINIAKLATSLRAERDPIAIQHLKLYENLVPY